MTLPALELLDELPGRGLLVRVAAGPCAGHVVLVVSGPPPAPSAARRRPSPSNRSQRPQRVSAARSARSQAVAEDLLWSLLDPAQRQSWTRFGVFWVDTPRGKVRLGRLYDLRVRSPRGPERSICVVPADHATLPAADVWSNLLLALRHDPDRFFRVANENLL